MKRVLIYSHDTFGLGNIRRMLEVARHLVQSSSQVSVLVITGSPMLHAFRIPAGIDYVKLPCLQRNVEGHYAARSLNLSLDDTVRLRANLIRSTIADFRPDLVLVDKKPFGVEDELAGALQALQEHQQRPRLVLLLRDILDSPQATARIWRKNGYFEAITTYYDQVLVVGCPQVFDMRSEYEFPPFAAARVRYCGYIAREPGRQTRSEMRHSLGVAGHERLLLVTPGGGEDGYALVDTALRGMAHAIHAGQAMHWRMHIVCGPEMAASQRQAVQAAAQALPGVSVQDFSDDMMSLQAAADVVLAMGGYNTVCELLSCGKRAVLVPRVKPGQEQLIRAERMARLGLLAMVHPDQLHPDTLMQAVRAELQALAQGEARPRLADLRGLQETTAAVFELIGLHDDAPGVPLHAAATASASTGTSTSTMRRLYS